MKKWNIYWEGRLLDEVFFTPDCDKQYVRTCLIEHDNFPSDILIEKVA